MHVIKKFSFEEKIIIQGVHDIQDQCLFFSNSKYLLKVKCGEVLMFSIAKYDSIGELFILVIFFEKRK